MRVLVIGDVMLDTYVWGEVERISPEAPVPIIRASRKTTHAGGAANVAANVAGLGLKATVIGCIGDDAEGELLQSLIAKHAPGNHLVRVSGHPTTHKSRIVGGHQQMLRIDVERATGYSHEIYAKVIAEIEKAAGDADAVVLSDYAKGLLTADVCRAAIAAARAKRIPVLVDPKGRDFTRYRGATTVCPNLHELSLAVGEHEQERMLSVAQAQVQAMGVDFLTVTMSDKGIAQVRPDTIEVMPARARQVFDVSGAGDTVIATLAAGLAAGFTPTESIELANLAAGIVVGKVGTVPIEQHELIAELSAELRTHFSEKILERAELAARVRAWRANGDTVVFTNGCFDLLHIGHVTLLEEARRMGSKLIVAINSDQSVSALKGPTRPMVKERERARILAALASVDAVTIFDEATPLECINAFRPDVLVKGGDYTEDQVVGAPEVRSWNGRVAIVPTVAGFSTTNLIAKMANSNN